MTLPRWLQWRSRRELDEEIQAHLDFATQAAIARGVSPEDAEYSARREMGNTTRVKERAREGDPLFRFEHIVQDVRYALRGLRRNPGFATAAILSLALGIGVNGTIFSFADALLLHPPDVPRASELVTVSASSPGPQSGQLSYREYCLYRDQNQTMAGLMAEAFRSLSVQSYGNDQARISFGHLVSGNYFSVLESAPMLGRSFLPEEDSPGAKDVVAVLSHRSWQADFHSDPKIAGEQIKLNGQPVTIIGVMAPEFRGMGDFTLPDFYLPLAAMDRLFPSDRHLADPANLYPVFGRLKPGVSVRSAQADFGRLTPLMKKAFPESDRVRSLVVLPIVASRMANDPDDARLIFLLLGIAATVLLVGCMNVANLLLGRASSRVREMTIRQSVGASRGRLIVQSLTESLVLVAFSAGAGLLLSEWAIHYLASVPLSPDLPSNLPARLDGRVLAYTLMAALATVVVSGLWPAVRGARVVSISPAKGAAGPIAASSFRGRHLLVGIQTALATMLLISASLFVKSFILAGRDSPGFRVENVLVMGFNPTLAGFSDARTQAFYREVRERVAKLPGVRSAALASHIPMGGGSFWNRVSPEEDGARKDALSVMFDRVGPGYFATMAVPILEGRAIDEHDTQGAHGVAVVNEALAQRFWPDGDALGRRIRFGDWDAAPVLQIVGIAGNGKYQSANDKFEPYLYIPDRQLNLVPMTLFAYTAGDPAGMVAAIRAEVQAVAADMPVYNVHTMKEMFQVHGLLGARLMAQMVGAMGAIGLTLGVLGLYAVIAFAVTRRTREIGIRMALGATAASVLRNVLASGVKVSAAGIAVGIVGAFELTRYAAEFLDRVSPHDPLAFFGVSILLLAAAIAACWAPARKASRVDPAVILRYE